MAVANGVSRIHWWINDASMISCSNSNRLPFVWLAVWSTETITQQFILGKIKPLVKIPINEPIEPFWKRQIAPLLQKWRVSMLGECTARSFESPSEKNAANRVNLGFQRSGPVAHCSHYKLWWKAVDVPLVEECCHGLGVSKLAVGKPDLTSKEMNYCSGEAQCILCLGLFCAQPFSRQMNLAAFSFAYGCSLHLFKCWLHWTMIQRQELRSHHAIAHPQLAVIGDYGPVVDWQVDQYVLQFSFDHKPLISSHWSSLQPHHWTWARCGWTIDIIC